MEWTTLFGIFAVVTVFAVMGRPLFMAALTANREVNRYVDQELRSYPVKAATRIYKGAFVGRDASTGYVRGLIAGDQFLGVAYEEIDNTSGASAAQSVRVFTGGDFPHALANAVITDNGKPVYATEDNTLTFASAGSSFVGWMLELVSNGTIILRTQTKIDTRFQRIVNRTQADTPVTLYVQDSGRLYKNLGATGQCTFSLPAAPPSGVIFHFVASAAQEVRIESQIRRHPAARRRGASQGTQISGHPRAAASAPGGPRDLPKESMRFVPNARIKIGSHSWVGPALVRAAGEVMFALVKRVTIRGRPYLVFERTGRAFLFGQLEVEYRRAWRGGR